MNENIKIPGIKKETPGTEIVDVNIENEKLRDEIKKLKIQLEVRDKLFKILSHDLRAPIGNFSIVIDYLLENLENGSSNNEELVEMMTEISKQSKSMAQLLMNLMKWIKLQNEGINPKFEIIDLVNQINDSIAPLLSSAKEKEINIKNKGTEKINIVGDPDMLQLIIRNITSNAIKFTENGGNILISFKNEKDNVEIYIKDDGIGLDENNIKSLFENIGNSELGTKGEKGTGLGLSLCKEMIEKMGGSISVESEGEGKGTTFIVTLPTGKNSIESK